MLPSPSIGAGRRLIDKLDRHPLQSVPQLARDHGLSRQRVQCLVDTLLKEGLAERSPNPAHKRSDLLRLTERGKTRARLQSASYHRFLRALHVSIAHLNLREAKEVIEKVRGAIEIGAWETDAEDLTGE